MCLYVAHHCELCCGVSGEALRLQFTVNVIINDLLSGLIMSILRENDLQTDLDPAGIHQVLTEHCNRQLCHILSSLLLMLMFFSLKWLPVIVFFLSCLPDVISPTKWQKKNHASGHLLDLCVTVLLEKKWQESEVGRKWKLHWTGWRQSRETTEVNQGLMLWSSKLCSCFPKKIP